MISSVIQHCFYCCLPLRSPVFKLVQVLRIVVNNSQLTLDRSPFVNVDYLICAVLLGA